MAVLSLPRRYPSLNCLFNNLKKSSICHTSTIPVSPNCQMDIFPMVSFGRLYQLFSATVFFEVFYSCQMDVFAMLFDGRVYLQYTFTGNSTTKTSIWRLGNQRLENFERYILTGEYG